MTPRLATGAALFTLWPGALPCQTVPSPKFEVASIRPSDSPDQQKSINITPGGGFRASNYSLKDLIKLGWGVRWFQISGGPKWLDSDRYNVEAKPEFRSEVRGRDAIEQLHPMVQSMLADRFKLKLHSETKEMNVYFLVVGGKGTSLKQIGETDKGTSSMHDGNGRLSATMIDTLALASYLGGELGVSVLDKTGLNGVYDIQLEWNPDENASAAFVSRPSIFTAVQEQLGLKLEPGRGPVEMLVVDYAEKASAN